MEVLYRILVSCVKAVLKKSEDWMLGMLPVRSVCEPYQGCIVIMSSVKCVIHYPDLLHCQGVKMKGICLEDNRIDTKSERHIVVYKVE